MDRPGCQKEVTGVEEKPTDVKRKENWRESFLMGLVSSSWTEIAQDEGTLELNLGTSQNLILIFAIIIKNAT